MKSVSAPLVSCVTAALCAGTALAHAHDDDHARIRLNGFHEVPSISTAATGSFEAKLAPDSFSFELSYQGLTSAPTQAHIHFGQKDVNGGISVFLCSNLGNGPAGTAACPSPGGTVGGTITAASVIGPAGQGISAGQFDKLLKAMRSGVTYVNVHSVQFPGGEVRGQLRLGD